MGSEWVLSECCPRSVLVLCDFCSESVWVLSKVCVTFVLSLCGFCLRSLWIFVTSFLSPCGLCVGSLLLLFWVCVESVWDLFMFQIGSV